MKSITFRGTKIKYLYKFIIFALLIAPFGYASVVEAVYTLPTTRSYPWQGNVGVPGGIPNRTTIYTTLTANGSDDTAQIQTALNNCPVNGVVMLNTGTFKLSGSIDWVNVKQGVVLRGNGPSNTKLMFSAGNIYMRTNGDWGTFTGTNAALTVNATKGDTTITVSSVPSWVQVGKLYLVSQLNDTSLVNNNGTEGVPTSFMVGREQNQLVKVASKTATTVTFEAPLAYSFSTAKTALLHYSGYNPSSYAPRQGCGLENFYMEATYGNSDVHFVKMENCDGCWIKNVEMYNAPGGCDIQANFSYRCEFRDSYFHYSHYYGAGQGYGIALYNSTFGSLSENNSLVNFHVSLEVGGGIGNVFGYNYETKGQADSGSTAAISHHQVHTYMNLWEGNYVTNKVLADFIHGSSSHNTVFRNRILGYDGVSTLNQNAVNFAMWNRHWNIIGNVLGVSGWNNIYDVWAPATCQDSSKLIYELGYYTPWACVSSGGYDSASTMDLVRHGNYDYVNNSTIWDAGISDHTLPASLYLTTKPAWWGNLPWPAIGPDVSPMFPTSMTTGFNPWGGSSVPKIQLPGPTLNPVK